MFLGLTQILELDWNQTLDLVVWTWSLVLDLEIWTQQTLELELCASL